MESLSEELNRILPKDEKVVLINKLAELLAKEDDTEAERYTLFPIKDLGAFEFYKQQEAMIWSNTEMDFSQDKDDYESFDEDLKHVIDQIFAFFSFADGRVIENIALRLLLMENTIEQRMFYLVQLFIEGVHSEFYSKTIDCIVADRSKRKMLFKALDEIPIMKKKDAWMKSYMEVSDPAYAILAYICVEGIFFQAGFVFFLWFKTIGKMDNVVFGNEQVRKDEAKHTEFGKYRFSCLKKKPPAEYVIRIVKEAVELELEFVDYVIPKTIEYRTDPSSKFPVSTLNPEDVKEYVKLTADHMLVSLDYEAIWNVDATKLPAWIQEMAMDPKNNFYEVRGGNYTLFSNKPSIGKKYGDIDDVDF